MLESIPAEAASCAVDTERKMIEDDLKRTEPGEYVSSVLSFCNFLLLAVVYRVHDSSIAAFPPEHRTFPQNVVQQLVDAGKLPSGDYRALQQNIIARVCVAAKPC
jgi:hypothetical protein